MNEKISKTNSDLVKRLLKTLVVRPYRRLTTSVG